MLELISTLCDASDKQPVALMRQEAFTRQLLTEVNQIVEFDNFPEDNNQTLFKTIAFREGMAGIVKDEGEYYVASVTGIGHYRKDGHPYKVNARYMKKGIDGYEVTLKTDLINDEDVVLYYNGGLAAADLNVPRFSFILSEIDKSIKANVKYTRMNPLIKVKDSKEKAQLDKAIKDSDIDNPKGENYTYISEETLKDLEEAGREVVLNLSDVSASDKIQYLSHLHLDIMNRFNVMFGVPANTTGKMAQQSIEEISGADAQSWLIPLDMLKEAKEFCERLKKTFGLDVSAHFGIIHEMNFQKFVNKCTLDLGAHEDPCEESDEEVDANDDNPGDLETEAAETDTE